MSPPPNTYQSETELALVPKDQDQALESVMGPEANVNSIRALEKQIEEGEGDIIGLKRARNSLLNISAHVPPEILGYIFDWCLFQDSPLGFEGLRKGSYNFLLVCHHWFEVASQTTELWSFWGNTLQDWKKRHHNSRATPLNLVLNGCESDPDVLFDEPLQDALKGRVMQDAIRQVHLVSNDHDTLAPIISSLTPDSEGGQNENIESIILENGGDPAVDVSDFFTRSRLLRLRCLELYGNIWISSWDRLASRTRLLTTLSLDIDSPPSLPTPTAAQLFSILTKNPHLRKLTLSHTAIPNDAHTSTFRVRLRNLKTLALTGEFRHILGLLRQLILQETLDEMWLSGSNPAVEDISQTLAPYMWDYFKRDARFQGRLGVYCSSFHNHISVAVGVVRTQITAPVLEPPYVSLKTVVDFPPPDVLGQLFINLTALIPRECVVSFHAWLGVSPPEEVFFMMPNIETLHLSKLLLSEGLLQPNPHGPYANRKLFPSLRSLFLQDVIFLSKGDWNHLMTYLAHQTSDGQTISLEVDGDFPHGCPEIVEGIRDLVKEFTYPRNPAAEGDE